MGRFLETVRFEKEHMPAYQFKFLYRMVLPSIIFILGGAVLCAIFTVIGAALDLMLLGLIPACIWGCVMAVLMVLIVVYSRKTSKRLIKDRTEELQSYFELIDYDKAKGTLASDNIIKDGYLIVDDEADPFDTKSEIKLDDCRIEFFCKTRSGAYIYALVFFAKADNVFLTTVELDKNSYTFFSRNARLIENGDIFELFMQNRKEFITLLHKYGDTRKMRARMRKRTKAEALDANL